MGTRSLTHVVDTNGLVLVTLYRQFDGYPVGHGMELAEFLKGMTVVNGFNSSTPKKSANGMGCLAAQLVAHFKTEIGQFYLMAPGISDCGEVYTYTVSLIDGVLMIKVSDGIEATPDEYIEYYKETEDA